MITLRDQSSFTNLNISVPKMACSSLTAFFPPKYIGILLHFDHNLVMLFDYVKERMKKAVSTHSDNL